MIGFIARIIGLFLMLLICFGPLRYIHYWQIGVMLMACGILSFISIFKEER